MSMHRRLGKTLAVLMLAAISSWALADPPERVGRISETRGQVTFRANDGDEAMPATLNWPVTSGNVFETAAGARAEIRVGSAAVRIAANSDLTIPQLDERHLTLQLNDGSASVRIRDSQQLDDFMLQTPNGRILLSVPSQIRVDVDGERTVVSVFSGAAQFEGTQSNLPIRSGSRADINGRAVRMSQLQPDAFDDWSLARDRRDDSSSATRYIAPETTGYEELDQYGNWQMSDDDGAVWYPRDVAADWAPYQQGQWAWITPWGWTWIDSAPWGYAPSHYGRWRRIGGRWGWLPGRLTAQPVWAPALVGWVGDNNWSVSFSSGNAPAVGWFPLAPREAYVPSYPASQTYLQRINRSQLTLIRQRPSEPHYQNRFVRDAITVVPQDRFTRGNHIDVRREHQVGAPSGQWQHAPVSPTAPPAIARHSHALQSAPAANLPPPRTEREMPWLNRDRRQEQQRPAMVMPPPRSTLQLQQQEQLQQRQQQEHSQQQTPPQPVLVAPPVRSEPRTEQALRPPRHDTERNVAPPVQPPVIVPPPKVMPPAAAPVVRERPQEREPRQSRTRPDVPTQPPLQASPPLPAAPIQGHVAPQMPQREERRLQQRENAPAQQRDELQRDPARRGGRPPQPWPQAEDR